MFQLRTVVALVVLAVSVLAGTNAVVAQEGTPESDGASLIAAYEAAFNAQDAAGVAALYAEDAVVTQAVQNGEVFEGRDAIHGWVADNLAAIPDLTLTTEAVVTEGGSIAWEWTYHGTYTGQFPGLPAGQGQSIELHGAGFFELQDGLIARETVIYDTLAFMTQVGAMATPAAASGNGTGSVTISVFACPADLARTADEEPVTQAELLAGCSPLDDPAAAPTLSAMPDGDPVPGEMTAPGVYRWDDLAVGDYVAGGEMPENMQGFRMSDAAGTPFQNPVVRVEMAGSAGEYFSFYFAE